MTYDDKLKQKLKQIFEDEQLNEVDEDVKKTGEAIEGKQAVESIPKMMQELRDMLQKTGIDIKEFEGEPLSDEQLKQYADQIYKTMNDENTVVKTVKDAAQEAKDLGKQKEENKEENT